MDSDYLSVTQVAQLKGTSRPAVYKAIEEGRLPATRLLDHLAIRRSDAEAWVLRRQTKPRPRKPRSEEVKAKISQSQKARWQKRQQQSSPDGEDL